MSELRNTTALLNSTSSCVPLGSLDENQLSSVIAVAVVVSLAVGFLLFIAYLTVKEAQVTKYNIRRMSEIERKSFSVPRLLSEDLPSTPGGRRATFDELYESYLPIYNSAELNPDHSTESVNSTGNEPQPRGSILVNAEPWTPVQEDTADMDARDTDAVLRLMYFPDEFEHLELGNNKRISRSATSSVKSKMKRSLSQVRHSLHSSSSMIESPSKSSLSDIEPPGYHHTVTSFNEFGRRRNGSVPAQLGSDRRRLGLSILRPEAKKTSHEFEHRMRHRRVAVSFYTQQYLADTPPIEECDSSQV